MSGQEVRKNFFWQMILNWMIPYTSRHIYKFSLDYMQWKSHACIYLLQFCWWILKLPDIWILADEWSEKITPIFSAILSGIIISSSWWLSYEMHNSCCKPFVPYFLVVIVYSSKIIQPLHPVRMIWKLFQELSDDFLRVPGAIYAGTPKVI